MAIKSIDREKCIGCGNCFRICSCDVFRMDESGKPVIRYEEECCLCLYCMKECPVQAIYVSPDKSYKQISAWD